MLRGSAECKLRFLTKPTDVSLNNALIRRITEPGSGEEYLYAVCNENLMEIIEENGPDRAVYAHGKFWPPSHHLFFSTLDPFFFVAAKLNPTISKSWEDLTSDFPELSKNARLCKLRDDYCTSVDDNYLATDEQLFKYYTIMFAKLCTCRIIHARKRLDMKLSTYLSMHPQISWFHEFVKLVPSKFHTKLAEHFNINLKAHMPKVSTIEYGKNEDKEAFKAPPPKKAKVSTSQKQLAKASKGTKSITGFFAPSK
uniref:Ribonuclease H2 subunit B wHTH domain-containing protein n=1 Tax=Panagrolaimus superbus TaxID=310955 RepID=A0A914Z0W3_9BILA